MGIMIQLLPYPLWQITQLLHQYKRYHSVHFVQKAFLRDGAENICPHIHSFVCSFIFLPVTQNISADQIWMKCVEMMNVRQRNKDRRMSAGRGEQPVMWKMKKKKIKNTLSPKCHLLRGNKKLKMSLFTPMIDFGLHTVSSENTIHYLVNKHQIAVTQTHR